MNTKEPYYDQIEAYLTGRLTPEQDDAMRRALRDDPELAHEVEVRRLEFEVSEALIAENIRGRLQDLRAEQTPDPGASKSRFKKYRLFVFFCVIAVMGIYWWTTRAPEPAAEGMPPVKSPVARPDTPPVPQAGAPAFPDASPKIEPLRKPGHQHLALATELYQKPDFEFLRSANTSPADPLEAALAAWQKQDYKAVIEALQAVAPDAPQYWRAMTLQAHAQFQLKQYKTAAQYFIIIADSKVQPWAEEADGYLLLALLAEGQGQTKVFQYRLGKVLADDSHPFQDMARTIRQRLR